MRFFTRNLTYIGFSSCLVAVAMFNCCLSLLNAIVFKQLLIIVSFNQSISLCERSALKGSLLQIVTADVYVSL